MCSDICPEEIWVAIRESNIIRTIEQRLYDLRRRYDTTYSQNVSQTVIVS